MARRFTAEWWTGVLVLAVLGWHAAFPVDCLAADQSPGATRTHVARVERANPSLAMEPVFQSHQPLSYPPFHPR